MSTIQGPGVSVTMPTGFNIKANNIDGSLAIPAADNTGFTDGGYGSSDPAGPCRVTGTVSGFTQFDASSTIPVPSALLASTLAPTNAQGLMTLTFTTGCSLAFTSNITAWNFSRTVPDSMTSAYPFESKGAPTLTWDETG